jgi:uncharacterized membrane protein
VDVIRSETTTVIHRPAAEIVAYLADIEAMTEWTDMTASRKVTDGPTGEGTRAYAEVALGPMKLGWTWEITDFDPIRGYGYRTVSKAPWAWTAASPSPRRDPTQPGSTTWSRSGPAA